MLWQYSIHLYNNVVMNKMTRIMMFALLWIACASGANAQTLVLGMPLDKHVNALKVYGDTLFAACGDGLYMKDLRKNDAWKVIAFEGRHITSMVKRGDDILAICKNIKYREDPSARYTSIVMTNIRSGQTEVCTPLWITKGKPHLRTWPKTTRIPTACMCLALWVKMKNWGFTNLSSLLPTISVRAGTLSPCWKAMSTFANRPLVMPPTCLAIMTIWIVIARCCTLQQIVSRQ